MALDNSVLALMLVGGEWKTNPIGEGKLYEFLPDSYIVIYTDHNYAKAEAATYTLTFVDGVNQLEITHTMHPIKTEVYEIVELDENKMIWHWFNGKHFEYINLVRVIE